MTLSVIYAPTKQQAVRKFPRLMEYREGAASALLLVLGINGNQVECVILDSSQKDKNGTAWQVGYYSQAWCHERNVSDYTGHVNLQNKD